MTTQEVANRLVELCRTGQILQAQEELYGETIVSRISFCLRHDER